MQNYLKFWNQKNNLKEMFQSKFTPQFLYVSYNLLILIAGTENCIKDIYFDVVTSCQDYF